MKLMPSTVTTIARPGNSGHHQLPCGMKFSELERALPQVGWSLGDAEAEVAHEGLAHDDAGDRQGRCDDHRAHALGQDVPEDDPVVADTHGARRLDEDLRAQGQEQAAHEARQRPAEDREDQHDQDQLPLPRNWATTRITNRNGQAEQDVDDAHQEVVDPAAEVARDAADRPRRCRRRAPTPMPIVSEIRAPLMTSEKTSRPTSSVPNRWASDGGSPPGTCAFGMKIGSYGSRMGAEMAMRTMNPKITGRRRPAGGA